MTPGVSGPWTIKLYAYNSSSVLLAMVTYSFAYQMLPFTNMSSPTVFTPAAFTQLANTTYGSPGTVYHSVAVDMNQTKLLFGSSGSNNIWYSTSSNNGTTWSTPIALSISNAPISVQISSDGTRAFYCAFSGYMYFINWSGATPAAPVAFTSCPTATFSSLTLIPDGSKVFCGTLGGNLHYGYWNGSGYTYGGVMNGPAGNNTVRLGCSLSNDGTGVIVFNANNNEMWHLSLTWSGNVATAGTWTKFTTTTYDSRGLVFLGGGASSAPSWVMAQPSSNSPQYFATFNSTTKTAGTFSTTLSPNGASGLGNDYGAQSFCPCGFYGNVIYFLEDYTNGADVTKFNISKVTYTVS